MSEQNVTNGYTTISIPVSFVYLIDAALKKGGYLNRADFVRDALRDKLLKISDLV
jgi:Arc/MetJ-type ribon-helix-helix transcriptional regulator